MSAAASEAAPLRFSGENEDGREYKRWKTWVKNKLLTLDKLPETARGAYIYTLLAGKALEAVEYLDPGDYQKKDGDQVLWSLLDKRFPQLEVVDELGEILGEVFNLRSQEGETMKQWAARASELFDRCHRKTGVQFPDEARGWLLLRRANLSEEQKAVVISRARGDLKRESIAAALRSCYPTLLLENGEQPLHWQKRPWTIRPSPTMPGKKIFQTWSTCWKNINRPLIGPLTRRPTMKLRWQKCWLPHGKSVDKSSTVSKRQDNSRSPRT